ncbi:FAD/NAD(P)-binding domain-containing protein [Mycena kentingensis (nom. inval.)]|nr:FAD/NAD(P)-binding domain-containing protein [Mycena kentingensis (nom. inval.)]
MLRRPPVVRATLTRTFSSSRPAHKERLVIVGSGWAGYPLLQGIDKKRWHITVVSPTGYFNFTPLLAGCAVGTLEFRCAVESTPATPPPAGTEPNTFPVRWDKLVIAAGAYSQTFGIPGVKEHAHFLKDVKDARAIRMRILECFEQAMQPTLTDIARRNLLNFCIVGGGPTGVEFAAELHDLLHAEVAAHYPTLAKLAKITIYDVAPSILGSFDRTLVEYAETTFSRDGISILTSHHVERVEAGKMFVKERGEVPFGLLVWSTGLAPNPLISSITEVKKDSRTQSLQTDENLNVLRAADGTPDPNVWAIGDCAQIAGNVLPATAQVANQKGIYLVKTLNKLGRRPDSFVPKPFKFENQGSLAYLGDWKAIYDRTGSTSKTTEEKLLNTESVNGRVAWLLWRSAYFTMTLSWRNKYADPRPDVLVRSMVFALFGYPLDLCCRFLNWIFGRDITRF